MAMFLKSLWGTVFTLEYNIILIAMEKYNKNAALTSSSVLEHQ